MKKIIALLLITITMISGCATQQNVEKQVTEVSTIKSTNDAYIKWTVSVYNGWSDLRVEKPRVER